MISKEQLIEKVFKNYVDPELGIDVWTLGLIYDISVHDDKVKVLLTFTSPLCPYGPEMIEQLKEEIKKEGAIEVEMEVQSYEEFRNILNDIRYLKKFFQPKPRQC